MRENAALNSPRPACFDACAFVRIVSIDVSTMPWNQPQQHGIERRRTLTEAGFLPCDCFSVWIKIDFGSEGWGFESLRARQQENNLRAASLKQLSAERATYQAILKKRREPHLKNHN